MTAATQVFDTSYTTALEAGAVTILLDSFDRQTANLASLLSLSPVLCQSDSVRPAFIEEFTQAARDSQEAVLSKIDTLLKNQPDALTSLQTSTQVEFVNLYLATLHSIYTDPASDALSTYLTTLISSISSQATLSSFLHFISPASPEHLRSTLLNKLISNPSFTTDNYDSLTTLPTTFETWSVSQSKADGYISTIVAQLEEAEHTTQAYSLLKAYFNSSYSSKANQDLQRKFINLSIHSPTIFEFPSFLSSFAEESTTVQKLFGNQQGEIQEEGLESKRISLKVSKLLGGYVGKKITYSEVSEKVGLSNDEEVIESVIIDAIKAKLIQARLHQPTQSISVLSSSYDALEAALPSSNLEASREKKLQQWKLIQSKLVNARKSLDGVMNGLKNVTGSEVEVAA